MGSDPERSAHPQTPATSYDNTPHRAKVQPTAILAEPGTLQARP